VFGYHLRLAFKSLRRTPGLTALMICAIALGISVCVVTLTVYDATARNPIWWKSDRLYAVTMDSWDPNEAADPKRPNLPPSQLTYKDAKYLLGSNIPERKVVMVRTQDVVSGGGAADAKPIPIVTRATTGDFFPTFDVPFLYGSGWTAEAGSGGPPPLIVLSKALNEKIFGGANSTGRTIRWNERAFRIIGVLDAWAPLPKFYDLTRGAFDAPEDAYVPFGWTEALGRFPNGGRVACWRNDSIDSFAQFLQSDCVWLQMWVQLKDNAAREHMQGLLEAYWAEQRKAGRFDRPRNNRLTSVNQWLIDQEVVQNDNRMLVGVAFAFFAVCLLNTIGMLLAKFLKGAAGAGIRRALGATRRDIFMQYLTEAGLLAVGGAVLGLALGALGLRGVHALYARGSIGPGGYQELMRFDAASLMWALVLAVAAALGAGVYPAWRVGRLPPAGYLKVG
jgi:putative ABC transport system permease protein